MNLTIMPGTAYERAMKAIEALAPADQLRLAAELMVRWNAQPIGEPRSLLELEGLGGEIRRVSMRMTTCARNVLRGMDRRVTRLDCSGS